MRKSSVLVYKIGISIVICSMILLLQPVPVLAATCSGSGCDNTDPSATGCSGNATVVHDVLDGSGIGYYQLKASNTCATYWTKAFNYGSSAHYLKAYLYYFWSAQIFASPNGTVYTNQQYTPFPVGGFHWQGCGAWSQSPIPADYPLTCTV